VIDLPDWIGFRQAAPLPDPNDLRAAHRWLADHPRHPVPLAWARRLASQWNRVRPVATRCCAVAFGMIDERIGCICQGADLERALIVGAWDRAVSVDALWAWGAA